MNDELHRNDELDRLAQALRTTAPRPRPEARDRAIAAALAEFDRLHRGGAPPAPPGASAGIVVDPAVAVGRGRA